MECDLIARDGVVAGGPWPTRKVKTKSWFGKTNETIENIPGDELRLKGIIMLLNSNVAVVPTGIFSGEKLITIPEGERTASASVSTLAVYIKKEKLLLIQSEKDNHPSAISLREAVVSLQVINETIHVAFASSHNNQIRVTISYYPNGIMTSSTDSVSIPAGLTVSAAFTPYDSSSYLCALLRFSVKKAIFTRTEGPPILATLTPNGVVKFYKIISGNPLPSSNKENMIVFPQFDNLSNVYKGNARSVAERVSNYSEKLSKNEAVLDICWVAKRSGDDILLLSYSQEVVLIDPFKQGNEMSIIFRHKFTISCTIILPCWCEDDFQSNGIEFAVLPENSKLLDLELQRIVPLDSNIAIKKALRNNNIDKAFEIAGNAGLQDDVVREIEWELCDKQMQDVQRIFSELSLPMQTTIAKEELLLIESKVNVISYLFNNKKVSKIITEGLLISLAGCMLLSGTQVSNDMLKVSGESVERSRWWKILSKQLTKKNTKRHPLLRVAKTLALSRNINQLKIVLQLRSENIPPLADDVEGFSEVFNSLPPSTTVDQAESILPGIGISTSLQISLQHFNVKVTEVSCHRSQLINKISYQMMVRSSSLGLHTISREWLRHCDGDENVMKISNEFDQIINNEVGRRLLFPATTVPTYEKYSQLSSLVKLCGAILTDKSRNATFTVQCREAGVPEERVAPLTKFSLAVLNANITLTEFPMKDKEIAEVVRSVIARQLIPTLGITGAIDATTAGVSNITTKVEKQLGIESVTENIRNMKLGLPTENVTKVFSKVFSKAGDVHQKLCQDVGLVQTDSPDVGIRVRLEFIEPVLEVLKQYVCNPQLDLLELLLRVLLVDGQHQAAIQLINSSEITKESITSSIYNSLDELINSKTHEVTLDGMALQTGRQIIAIFDQLVAEGIEFNAAGQTRIETARGELESLLAIVVEYSNQLPIDLKSTPRESILRTVLQHCDVTETDLHVLIDNVCRLGSSQISIYDTIINYTIESYKPELAMLASRLLVNSHVEYHHMATLLESIFKRFDSVISFDDYRLISSALVEVTRPNELPPLLSKIKMAHNNQQHNHHDDNEQLSYDYCISNIITQASNIDTCSEEMSKIDFITEAAQLDELEESERKGLKQFEKTSRLLFESEHTEVNGRRLLCYEYQKASEEVREHHSRLWIQYSESISCSAIMLYIPSIQICDDEEQVRCEIVNQNIKINKLLTIISEELLLRNNYFQQSSVEWEELFSRMTLSSEMTTETIGMLESSISLIAQNIKSFEDDVEQQSRRTIIDEEFITHLIVLPVTVEFQIEVMKLTQLYFESTIVLLPDLEKSRRRVISAEVKLGYRLLGIEGTASFSIAEIQQAESSQWNDLLSDFEDGTYDRQIERLQSEAITTMTTTEVSEHIQWQQYTQRHKLIISEWYNRFDTIHNRDLTLVLSYEDEFRFEIDDSEDVQFQLITNSKQSEQSELYARLESLGLFIIQEEDERRLVSISCSTSYSKLQSDISISLSNVRDREVDRLRMVTKYENELQGLPKRETMIRSEITFEQSSRLSDLMAVCDRERFTAMALSVGGGIHNKNGSSDLIDGNQTDDDSPEGNLLSVAALLRDDDLYSKFESQWAATRPPLQPSPNFLKLSVAVVSSLIALSPQVAADAHVVLTSACHWLCQSVCYFSFCTSCCF